MFHSLLINDWLLRTSELAILDVRSEAEHAHAHIPGAYAFPLLNNQERAVVGTVYKQQGNEAAVLKGYELVGSRFAQFIIEAKKLAPNKEVGVYCWRGGLRSNIMAFVLHTAGFKVHLLKGGYKQYRNWVTEQFTSPKQLVVVGGKTGCGKTTVIETLAAMGEQTIHLEQLANHRGSAFGGLGQPAQPSVEQFENKLAMQWSKLVSGKPVFIENESRTIGSVVIPLPIFETMKQATTFAIDIPFAERVQHIVAAYGLFDKTALANCTAKLAKRLGDLRLREVLQLLNESRLDEWATLLLAYYDKTYEFGNTKRKEGTVQTLSFESFDAHTIARTILTHLQQHG
ncbi:MAG: tRNA 2-selenouridine(34) synthase MnmH [Bacteroidia bacterium]|nr:tRNA 2-selenouridine(34) synthase MnmH [Bacteroidia bacterium]